MSACRTVVSWAARHRVVGVEVPAPLGYSVGPQLHLCAPVIRQMPAEAVHRFPQLGHPPSRDQLQEAQKPLTLNVPACAGIMQQRQSA